MNRHGHQEEGVAYVEFLVVFGPLMTFWLCLAQLGLAYGAHLAVAHAAARAVRAAIVILPDDEEGWEDRYDSVAPLTVGSSGSGLDAYDSAPQGGRFEAIRRAARLTLAPVSPDLGVDVAGKVGALFAGYLWTRFAVAVTFPDGDDGYRSSFPATGPLTARVTFLYRCPVPVADRLVCAAYRSITGGSRKELGTVDAELIGAAALGEELAEVAANGLEGIGAGSRFLALTAERTLPLQGRLE